MEMLSGRVATKYCMIEQERNETNIANIGQIATFTLFDLGRLI
jgi:hypothetical protein